MPCLLYPSLVSQSFEESPPARRRSTSSAAVPLRSPSPFDWLWPFQTTRKKHMFTQNIPKLLNQANWTWGLSPSPTKQNYTLPHVFATFLFSFQSSRLAWSPPSTRKTESTTKQTRQPTNQLFNQQTKQQTQLATTNTKQDQPIQKTETNPSNANTKQEPTNTEHTTDQHKQSTQPQAMNQATSNTQSQISSVALAMTCFSSFTFIVPVAFTEKTSWGRSSLSQTSAQMPRLRANWRRKMPRTGNKIKNMCWSNSMFILQKKRNCQSKHVNQNIVANRYARWNYKDLLSFGAALSTMPQ